MSHTLRFPFRLPAGQDIGGLSEPVTRLAHGLNWSIKQESKSFVITVVGLTSEEDCREYSKRIWSGFNWLLLKNGVAPIVRLEFDKVVYSKDPEATAKNLEKSMGLPYSGPVHGLVDKGMLAAFPSDQNIRLIGAGNVTLVLTTPVGAVVDAIMEGIEIRSEAQTIEDHKLQIALDLFAAYWLENTANAKLLTLMLALESLMTHPPRHQVVVELLAKWQPDVESEMKQYVPGSEEFVALESLARELVFKQTDSLRRQVRSLVIDSLVFLNQNDAEDKAREAVWVYDQRSTLVHEGELPDSELSRATTSAKEIVPQVLEARFRGFMGAG